MKNMMQDQTKEYLKIQINTASREQLLVMLYDGAIKFCELARHAIRDGNIEDMNTYLIRVQRIIMELMGSLNMEAAPDFAVKLMSLYQFANGRLIEANITRDDKKIDEALAVIRPLRDAWAEAATKMRKEQAADLTAPQTQSRLSISG